MRTYHRWLSVFFGVIMVFVAITGVLHYAVVWWPTGDVAVAPPAPPPGFECPEGWRCIAPPPEGSPIRMLGFIHHLHSGEEFGLIGEVLVMLSGLALVFFSFSGLWMYVQMWSGRKKRNLKNKLFWD